MTPVKFKQYQHQYFGIYVIFTLSFLFIFVLHTSVIQEYCEENYQEYNLNGLV